MWNSVPESLAIPAPSAIVFPGTTEEVQAIVRLANVEKFALVPSGGRTGLSAGAVAAKGEVVISFDRMNKVLEFHAADRLDGDLGAAGRAFANRTV